MKFKLLLTLFACASFNSYAQNDSAMLRKISDEVMLNGTCYENLRVLCKKIGHRLSGSPQAEEAVKWGQKTMEQAGADKVWLQPVDVPFWIRGQEKLSLKFKGDKAYKEVPVLSIGNTIGTGNKPLEASIIIVQNLDEFKQLPADTYLHHHSLQMY